MTDYRTTWSKQEVGREPEAANEYVWALEAEVAALRFAEREWREKALELIAEREAVVPNRPTD